MNQMSESGCQVNFNKLYPNCILHSDLKLKFTRTCHCTVYDRGKGDNKRLHNDMQLTCWENNLRETKNNNEKHQHTKLIDKLSLIFWMGNLSAQR